MDIEELYQGIYLDPLTELPNFFKFIESDTKAMFGEDGAFIIFDLANFSRVNEVLGTDIGDICLKTLAKSINKVIYDNGEEKKLVFRMGGDEFIIILPKFLRSAAEEVASSITICFKKYIMGIGVQECELHSLILTYNNPITSIEHFYEMLFMSSFNDLSNKDNKFIGQRLVRGIIWSFTNNVRRNLFNYNNAYRLALTDDISGLSNHRAAKAYLSKLLNKYKDELAQFSILFIDGDSLKRYNSISYESGNQMIRKLSEIIKSSIRKDDKVYRWLSGDEFLVILDNVNRSKALALAERIRQAVEEQTQDLIFPLTISIGIASYPADSDDINEVIIKAEKANSNAKSMGKNKVISWADL